MSTSIDKCIKDYVALTHEDINIFKSDMLMIAYNSVFNKSVFNLRSKDDEQISFISNMKSDCKLKILLLEASINNWNIPKDDTKDTKNNKNIVNPVYSDDYDDEYDETDYVVETEDETDYVVEDKIQEKEKQEKEKQEKEKQEKEKQEKEKQEKEKQEKEDKINKLDITLSKFSKKDVLFEIIVLHYSYNICNYVLINYVKNKTLLEVYTSYYDTHISKTNKKRKLDYNTNKKNEDEHNYDKQSQKRRRVDKERNAKEFVKKIFKCTSQYSDDDIEKYYTSTPDSDKYEKALTELQQYQTSDKPQIFKIMDMPLPISQKNNILKQYTNLINSRFSENKLKTWFDSVMTIPFNIYKGINLKTMINESPKKIKKFLNKLQDVMDKAVFGHDDAKRQIIQTMGQHIRNPTAKGSVLGLWGPMGNGKCFAADTPILMYDGERKSVQDVKIGDVLMGDDSKPRNVLSLGSGEDEMYEIISKNESYTVNSEHILCLKVTNLDDVKYLPNSVDEKNVVEITVRDYLKLPDNIKNRLKGYKTGVDFSTKQITIDPYTIGLFVGKADVKNIPNEYKINDRQTRLKLLAGLIDSDGYYNKENECFEITQKSKILSEDILFLCRSLGFASYQYKKDELYYITIHGNKLEEIPIKSSNKINKSDKTREDVLEDDIQVISKGHGNYYGFMIDGNERFVLGNFTVTHNTTLIKEGIAKAMDKPFVFISLGGATDSSFLEGHSYTYEGSIYGRIMNGIIASKCMDPIIYFDELDKISKTHKGDEIVNLLIHLTDPAQNNHFRDKYFHGIDIDLSRATMIFSFNDPCRVNPILLDRITTVETKFLMTAQKIHIAQNYLIPEMMKDMGLEKDSISINDDVLRHIIDSYTREGGVRKLKALLYMIIRELNLANLLETLVEEDTVVFPFEIKFDHIKTLLKHKTIIDPDTINSVSKPGVINGLYATSIGVGGVLPIEILKMPATRPYEIKTTGNLEKVIKESTEVASTLAFNCLDKKLQDKYALEWKKKPYGFHIHCPEGATPKDGPSAGTALTVALYSMLTGMKVRNDIAITGEINLQGKVTAIGGLENKLEGAKKTGVKLVLCPKENQKHLDKIIERNPTLIDNNFKVITIESINEAFNYSLID